MKSNDYGVYGRKWTKDIDDFILAEIPIANKSDLLILINTIWGRNFSYNALTAHCSESKIRLMIKPWQNNRSGVKAKALYSEQIKKGYVRIKTEKGWMQKQRWIYEQTHPEYVFEKGDTFIFLDGYNRNFSADNIELLRRREQYVFQSLGGIEKDNPELTRLKIFNVRLKLANLDAGEKLGLVVTYGSGRNFKKDLAKKSKERYAKLSEEEKKDLHRHHYEMIKANPEQCEKVRAYRREYYKRRKQNGNRA